MADESSTPETRTVTELFGRDHRRLDGLLADTKRSLAAGELERAATLFSQFREGLERHIVAEEEVLFPVFEELTGIAGGPTTVMRSEHAEIRRYLAEVADRLQDRADQDRTTPLAALTALLYAHNGKEEKILYPMTDRAAEEAGRLDALVARTGLG